MSHSIDAVLGRGQSAPEPGVEHPRQQIAWQLNEQARACVVLGSPL